jgi:hypothetical protein
MAVAPKRKIQHFGIFVMNRRELLPPGRVNSAMLLKPFIETLKSSYVTCYFCHERRHISLYIFQSATDPLVP